MAMSELFGRSPLSRGLTHTRSAILIIITTPRGAYYNIINYNTHTRIWVSIMCVMCIIWRTQSYIHDSTDT